MPGVAGGHVDTRCFFLGLGVSDEQNLASLVAVFGPTCGQEILVGVRNLVMRGCFRGVSDLGQAVIHFVMSRDLGGSAELATAVDAVVAVREYRQMQTTQMLDGLAIYCRSEFQEQAGIINFAFGASVPEWLFPAIITVAQRCAPPVRTDDLNGDPVDELDAARAQFVEQLTALFAQWGFQAYRQDNAAAVGSRKLAEAFLPAFEPLLGDLLDRQRWDVPCL